MPDLGKVTIAALVAGATMTAPAAAFASAAPTPAPRSAASAVTTANTLPTAIRKVPCRSWTFNVYHGTRAVTCYEGTGTLRPDIRNVHEITTGKNTGLFCAQEGTSRECVIFRPGERFTFPSLRHAELTILKITHT